MKKLIVIILILTTLLGFLPVRAMAADTPVTCGVSNFISGSTACSMVLFFKILETGGYLILGLVSWILWASGIMLNLSIITAVIHMSSLLDKITVIFTIWKILRDFVNMFFIFILLFIAIQTILDFNYDYKKILRNVVLVALFINFSFFATGVLIDFSNTLALMFYNGFSDSNCKDPQSIVIGIHDGCMSYNVVQSLYLTTIYSAPNDDQYVQSINSTNSLGATGKFLTTVIAGSILMIVLSGVFLASAVLIIYRFVTLILLLMLSPLAFAAMILPSTNKYWKDWWNKLTSQLIFAPVYFMFLWISMKIITSGTLRSSLFIASEANFKAAFGGSQAGLFGLIINYIIIISLLVYSLTLAGELGATGVKAATSVANGFQGYIGKRTVGNLANRLDKRWEKNTGVLGGRSFVGSRLRSLTTSKLAESSFTGGESAIQYKKGEDDRKKGQKEQVRTNADNAVIKTGIKALENKPTPLPADATPAQTAIYEAAKAANDKLIQDMATVVQRLGQGDLREMKADDLKKLIKEGMVNNEQMMDLLNDKNEKHSAPEKDGFRSAFSERLDTALNNLVQFEKDNQEPTQKTSKYKDDDLTAEAKAEREQIALEYQEAKQKYIADPVKSAKRDEARKSLEKEAKKAMSEIGDNGVNIVNPQLITGKGAKSEKFVQLASGNQYKNVLEKTHREGKDAIREARFKTVLEGEPSPDKIIRAFKNFDGADIAQLAKNSKFAKLIKTEGVLATLNTKKLTDAIEKGLDIEDTKFIDALKDVTANEKNNKNLNAMVTYLKTLGYNDLTTTPEGSNENDWRGGI